MKTIEWDQECVNCKGTGIYTGMGERDGFGVVCHSCKGTGKREMSVQYEPFVARKKRSDIKRVVQTNPGIGLGGNLAFGGMSYEKWVNGAAFKQGMEMRNYTCPAWWYQCADYKKKPEWKECIVIGSFSACGNFGEKHRCWEKFDSTSGEKG